MSNQVKDMTWREVQERLREFPVVIVPIGSTEQHGYHLPIGTDVYLAEALAEKTAEKTCILCKNDVLLCKKNAYSFYFL